MMNTNQEKANQDPYKLLQESVNMERKALNLFKTEIDKKMHADCYVWDVSYVDRSDRYNALAVMRTKYGLCSFVLDDTYHWIHGDEDNVDNTYLWQLLFELFHDEKDRSLLLNPDDAKYFFLMEWIGDEMIENTEYQ